MKKKKFRKKSTTYIVHNYTKKEIFMIDVHNVNIHETFS